MGPGPLLAGDIAVPLTWPPSWTTPTLYNAFNFSGTARPSATRTRPPSGSERDDLGPRRPERLGPVVIRPHQGPDRQALAAEDVDHLSAHPSDPACGAGDENR